MKSNSPTTVAPLDARLAPINNTCWWSGDNAMLLANAHLMRPAAKLPIGLKRPNRHPHATSIQDQYFIGRRDAYSNRFAELSGAITGSAERGQVPTGPVEDFHLSGACRSGSWPRPQRHPDPAIRRLGQGTMVHTSARRTRGRSEPGLTREPIGTQEALHR